MVMDLREQTAGVEAVEPDRPVRLAVVARAKRRLESGFYERHKLKVAQAVADGMARELGLED